MILHDTCQLLPVVGARSLRLRLEISIEHVPLLLVLGAYSVLRVSVNCTSSFLLTILLSNHGHCRRRRVQVSVSGSVIVVIVCLKPHSYSLTVFSPSGKLVQIEHALAAVSQGTTSLGIKGIHPLTSLL